LTHRIEIKNKDKFKDGREKNILTIIEEDADIKLDDVKIINCYNLFGDYSKAELEILKNELFCDPVLQDNALGFYFAKNLNYDFLIEVSYLPGVTDNVGRSSAKGISNTLKRHVEDNDVRSSILYLFKGKIDNKSIEKIAKKALCNTLIEKYFILTKDEVAKGKTIDYEKPGEHEITPPYYRQINLDISDKDLIKISDDFVLSLSLEEMHAIRDYYKQKDVIEYRKTKGLPAMPTNVELEVFAQTWSEHCKHKIFAADLEYDNCGKVKNINSLYKTYIKDSTKKIMEKRDDLLSVFVDNAGVVKFNEEYAYCVKVETHNSPSALDPYGGAMTGIVGVNRDIIGTGMGAYPIFNTDVFCFASPFTEEKDVPDGLLHPRRIFRGVHRGIKDGGNESGIPTVNGSIVFDESFIGKPLVFCGTGGLMPLKIGDRASYKKYIKKGDLIVMCGGRIGKDGIHGATFSSAHLTESSPTSAVQIGDPITQKKMLDFIMEARDLGLYSGLTDNGAGGLSSSVGEMASFTGGAVIDLEKCPLKYHGLEPWEILLSEAQERMSVAVPEDKINEFLELSKKRDVESTVIGKFNDTGYFECRYNGQVVCSLDMKMLHEGVPKLKLKAKWNSPDQKRLDILNNNYKDSLRKLLASPNIASKEYWVRIYDHEVQARTVGKPFSGRENDGPSDGAVLKIFPYSNEGLVITHGIVPRYSKIDSYQMAANAIDEAYRSAVILGANPDKIVGLDNFCWPDPVESKHTPDGQYKLAQLVRACEAVYDITTKYNCPCISGKDSMKNDFRKDGKKISVLPTLLFTAVGKIDDIRITRPFYFSKQGSLIYLLGKTGSELGASEYYSINKIEGGLVPVVKPDEALSLYKNIHEALKKNLILSAHDLSDGGLIVALAEACFSGNLGCNIDLNLMGKNLSDEEKLFSESPSRILVSIDRNKEDEFLKLFDKNHNCLLGEVTDNNTLVIKSNGSIILQDDLMELKSIWKNSLIF
jgi:phosphoribosylformylglycinamidine synthase